MARVTFIHTLLCSRTFCPHDWATKATGEVESDLEQIRRHAEFDAAKFYDILKIKLFDLGSVRP